jgi:hypothetical protein
MAVVVYHWTIVMYDYDMETIVYYWMTLQ